MKNTNIKMFTKIAISLLFLVSIFSLFVGCNDGICKDGDLDCSDEYDEDIAVGGAFPTNRFGLVNGSSKIIDSIFAEAIDIKKDSPIMIRIKGVPSRYDVIEPGENAIIYLDPYDLSINFTYISTDSWDTKNTLPNKIELYSNSETESYKITLKDIKLFTEFSEPSEDEMIVITDDMWVKVEE